MRNAEWPWRAATLRDRKLLEQMREVKRLKHYSIRTERSYCDWVRRYVKFHGMKERGEMLPAEPKMEGGGIDTEPSV